MSHALPRRWLACTLTTIVLLAPACGDDESPEATPAPSSSTTAVAAVEPAAGPDGASDDAYCEAVAAMNSGDVPTLEDIESYAAVTPEGAQEYVAEILEVLEANGGNFMAVMSDADGSKALDGLVAFEEQTCGPPAGEPEQDPSVTEIDPSATRIDVATVDYDFEFDAPTTAGTYSFVSTNQGNEAHLMILLKLEPGATLEQVVASEGEEGMLEFFESDVAPPGGEMVVTAALSPGEWILLCPIPDAEGTTHVEHGMVAEFTIA